MKISAFSLRNAKELVRDKLNLVFGIGFPVILLGLLTLIQSNIPVDLFSLSRLTPGIAVFGLSFISLFSASLISKDRSTSFMLRLYTSPMKARDFIFGYTLPLFVISLAQMLVCFAFALVLGLETDPKILLCIIVTLPSAVLYVGIGLLCGSFLSDKQVGGICGALLTNVSAWLSGTWFDLELVGGGFRTVSKLLPFCHAVDAGRYALSGQFGRIMPELIWVICYAGVVFSVSIVVFTRRMHSDNAKT